MSSCKEIRSLLGKYADHELGEGDVSRVDNHLSVCEKCAEAMRLMEREAELLRGAFETEDVPAGFGVGLWESLQQRSARRPAIRWVALAAAAGIVLALLIGVVSWPPAERPPLARVTTCSGPLETRRAGGTWQPLATYALLRDGDGVRCGDEDTGTLVLNTNRRFDLDANTELTFLQDEENARVKIKMPRGRIHADLFRLDRSLNILTPVANVFVAAEDAEASGRAEFEMRLTGVPDRVGLIGRIHILPAAYAAEDDPQLEVIVYAGSVQLINRSRLYMTVGSGQRIVVGAEGPMPEPEVFAAAARRTWWEPTGVALAATARKPPETPVGHPRSPAQPKPPGAPKDVVPAPPDAKLPLPPRTPPRTTEADSLPTPTGLVARPDINAVLLTWKPVEGRERPVVEYGIYRRAAGEAEFALVGRFPVPSESVQKYVFQDDGLSIGVEYQYAVAAASRGDDGGLVEGKLSEFITGSPADFRIHYKGGDKDLAIIEVEKWRDGEFSRCTFPVRKRDPATGETGEIGRPGLIEIEPMPGTKHKALVDFSTGYYLVDIVTDVEHRGGIPMKRSTIIIENRFGVKRKIRQLEPSAATPP